MLIYGLAVAVVAAALLFRLAFYGLFGVAVPYLQFYPAILVASWYGGLGPGLLSTGLAGLATMYFFLPPEGFGVGVRVDQVSLGVFIATGVAIAWLNDRLRNAARLASNQARQLAAIINTSADGIIVIDDCGTIEMFNHAAERLFGYPAGEVIGRNVNTLMPSPEHEQHDGYLQRYLSTGQAKIIGSGRDVTGRRRDGSLVPVHLSVGEMTIDGQRKFTGMLHDLTPRAQLADQLRSSEARWRAIIESAVDGIIVIDAHARIESFNPASERLFGYTEDEVLGKNVNILMPSPYREEHDTYMARYLATGHAKIIGVGREVTGRRKDGSTFPLHLAVGEISVGGERKFTGIVHDLSERVRMEHQLRDQTTLARLGEMAAVIAHEVKNPLAGIRGAIQVVGGRMPKETPDAAILKEIVSRIDALDQMMKELLMFARPPQPKRNATDLAALFSATANLLAQDPAWSGVEVSVTGSAPPVSADADMLRIVFQNLLINAAHAMQGRGRIQVAIDFTEAEAHIALADSGPGIPPDIRDKVLVPFFTTKSRGTGLGLPTAKRLVDAHHGSMTLECPPSGGTTIHIRLPFQAP